MAKILVYDDDLTKIDIIVKKGKINLLEEELEEYDNYIVLNENLEKQLKEAVKKLK